MYNFNHSDKSLEQNVQFSMDTCFSVNHYTDYSAICDDD